MKPSNRRELVVEVERVRTYTRRAWTGEDFCPVCSRLVDFLPLSEAVRLFDIHADDLIRFMTANSCHFLNPPRGELQICLAAFLAALRLRKQDAGVKLIGE